MLDLNFDSSDLIAFMLGIVLTLTYKWAKVKIYNRTHPDKKMAMPKPRLVWITGFIAIVMVLASIWSGTEAQNAVRELAVASDKCQREFFTVLQARSKISEDNDYWSFTQRNALADWINNLLMPPPPFDTMDRTSKEYQNWTIEITDHYYEIIKKAQDEQKQNMAERANNPLPEPTCGH